MKPQQWARVFEQTYGRKPTPAEFSSAKRGGFAHATIGRVSSDAPQPVWPGGSRQPDPEKFNTAQSHGSELADVPHAGADGNSAAYQHGTAFTPTASIPTAPIPAAPIPAGASPVPLPARTAPTMDLADVADVVDTSDAVSQVAPSPAASASGAGMQQAGRRGPKHVKLVVSVCLALAVLIWLAVSAGYFFFHYFGNSPTGFRFYWTDQSSTLTRFVDDYNANGPLGESTKSWYLWSDTHKPIADKDLSYAPDLPKRISADASSNNGLPAGLAMEKTGTQYLILPKYQVMVTPQNLTVTANTKGLDIALANTHLATSDSEAYTTSVKHVFPGSYALKASGTVNGVKVDIAQQAQASSGNAIVDFSLTFITFHLYSNVSNADVYVGDSKIGTLDGGDYKFNQIPVLAGQQIQVRKNFRDGVVKTGTTPVDSIDDGSSVYLNWGQELTMNAAGELFGNAENIFADLAYGNSPSNVSGTFDGGTNNPMYATFQKDISDKTSPIPGFTPSSIYFQDLNVDGITQTGVNTYDVSWSLTWDFSFSWEDNADGSQSASGDFYQTTKYTAQVRYVPGSNAAGEDSSTGASDVSDNADQSGSGDDVENFLIQSLVGESSIANTKNGVTVESNDL